MIFSDVIIVDGERIMAESDESYRSWTVEQLKAFLRERRIPLSGNKKELVQKVTDIVHTDRLEEDIKAIPFQITELSILSVTLFFSLEEE